MNAVIIIPARMAATRLPGKPLVKIAEIPLITHCFFRAQHSKLAKQVYVATCDEEIANEIRDWHGNVVMTSHCHERATDRTAEALLHLTQDIDVVVMLQGDEPLINPRDLDRLIQHHQEFPDISVCNLTQQIQLDADFQNVNTVKVITNLNSNILAFSREPIPSQRLIGLHGYKPIKQLGIISFKKEALLQFAKLAPTPLEKIESVDMLRFLEHGYSIKSVLSDSIVQSVDTELDAMKAENLLYQDELYQRYIKKMKCSVI